MNKYTIRKNLMLDIQKITNGELKDYSKQEHLNSQKIVAKIHYDEIDDLKRSGYIADNYLMLELTDLFDRWGVCFYTKHIDSYDSILKDIQYILNNYETIYSLSENSYSYNSDENGIDFIQWVEQCKSD
jgi:hypothetical protein